MSMGWDEIARVTGFPGLKAHAEDHVLPVLQDADLKARDTSKLKGKLGTAVGIGFVGFFIGFNILQLLMPDNFLGEVLVFLAFPVMFFGAILGALFLFRRSLLALMIDAKRSFLVRGKAMTALVEPLGITYVAMPGGLPQAARWLLDQSWAPKELADLAAPFRETGGMEEAVAAARDAGLMIDQNVYIVGTAEQKARHQKLVADYATVEDGFHGRRGGIDFELFEWVEQVNDAPSIHHLVVVLEAPFRLHGITQLRARKVGWPQEASEARLLEVDLGPRAFEALYRLRSSDQVEARAIFNPAVIERVIALAHGGRFRAVARGERLVFDFAGENRFNLVNIMTGEWSAETLRQTAADLAQALSLVDTLAHAFMLARKSDTGEG